MIRAGSISGHFDLRVYDAYTGRLTKELSFPNLITDRGLMSYCGNGVQFGTAYVCVGNGTAAPDPLDTTLQSFLAKSDTSIGGTFNGGYTSPSAPDWISTTKGTCRFNAGRFDGTTISEIGITNNQNTNYVWCRALILDAYGAPTTLTILSNEYLDVTYTLKYHPDLTDTQFTFELGGTTYQCTSRVAQVNSTVFNNSGGSSPLQRGPLSILAVYNSQTLGAVTSEPVYSSGGKATLSQPSSASYEPYSSATPFTHSSQFNINTTQGNFAGGIGAMLVGNNTYFARGILSKSQISFEPKLPKDSNTEMRFWLSKTVSRWTAPTP